MSTGFIGLGTTAKPMATRLRQQGLYVSGCDLSGAAMRAFDSEVESFESLAAGEHVRAVYERILAATSSGQIAEFGAVAQRFREYVERNDCNLDFPPNYCSIRE